MKMIYLFLTKIEKMAKVIQKEEKIINLNLDQMFSSTI